MLLLLNFVENVELHIQHDNLLSLSINCRQANATYDIRLTDANLEQNRDGVYANEEHTKLGSL